MGGVRFPLLRCPFFRRFTGSFDGDERKGCIVDYCPLDRRRRRGGIKDCEPMESSLPGLRFHGFSYPHRALRYPPLVTDGNVCPDRRRDKRSPIQLLGYRCPCVRSAGALESTVFTPACLPALMVTTSWVISLTYLPPIFGRNSVRGVKNMVGSLSLIPALQKLHTLT